MDATQVLDDFEEEEKDDLISLGVGKRKTVAFLKVQSVSDFPETVFPVYEGENIIGRYENCDITIPIQAVSKKHACIEVHGKHHLICDNNSHNKTKRNQMLLKPNVFYELVHKVELELANVKCQYLLAQEEDVSDTISDSGSETLSESMVPQSLHERNEEPKEEVRRKDILSSVQKNGLDQETQAYSYNEYSVGALTEGNETDGDETDNGETDDGGSDNDETDDETGRKDKIKTSNNNPITGVPNPQVEPDTFLASPCTQTGDFESARKLEGSVHSVDVMVDMSCNGNEPTTDATLPCGTLPDTLVDPDVIPGTPLSQTNHFDPVPKLRRSVDVRVDTSRRDNEPTIAATLLCGTLPNSQTEPDSIPETPFTQNDEFERVPKLQRSVDVRVDTSRRASDGNTLAYGLSSLESPNKTRESMDLSLSENGKEPVKNKLLFDDTTDKITSIDVKEAPADSARKPNKPLENDMLATQMAEAMSISGSPEFFLDDSSYLCESPEETNKVPETPEKNPPEENPPQNKFEGQTSGSQACFTKTSEALTSGGEAFDEMMQTQPYGVETEISPEYDYEEMPTQAYGSPHVDDLADDEIEATQLYGDEDINPPQVSGGFKVPGTLNTHEMNEYDFDATQAYGDEDINVPSLKGTQKAKTPSVQDENNVKTLNDECYNDMDVQATQSYIEDDAKESGDTSESSELRSLASHMGLKSDSDSDFMSGKKSSRMTVDVKSSTPRVRKPSIVFEGVSEVRSEKRCYVECPISDDDTNQKGGQDTKSAGVRKNSVKGRKKSTATRGKAPRQTNEDTVGTSGTRIHDDAVMPENTEEKTAGGVVGNRGKGRTRRDKKSTTTTRESSSGRNGEMVGCGDSTAEIGIENLSMGMKTKKRQLRNRDSKISHNEKDPTSVKCEKDSIVEETKEEQINISSVAEDDFKISSVGSPETSHFFPKKAVPMKAKRPVRRGKASNGDLELDNQVEITNTEVERQQEHVQVKGNASRETRGKKSQRLSKTQENENLSDDIRKGEEIYGGHQTENKRKEVKRQEGPEEGGSSSRKGKGKRNKALYYIEVTENSSDDLEKREEVDGGQRTESERKKVERQGHEENGSSSRKGKGKRNKALSKTQMNENSSDNIQKREEMDSGQQTESQRKKVERQGREEKGSSSVKGKAKRNKALSKTQMNENSFDDLEKREEMDGGLQTESERKKVETQGHEEKGSSSRKGKGKRNKALSKAQMNEISSDDLVTREELDGGQQTESRGKEVERQEGRKAKGSASRKSRAISNKTLTKNEINENIFGDTEKREEVNYAQQTKRKRKDSMLLTSSKKRRSGEGKADSEENVDLEKRQETNREHGTQETFSPQDAKKLIYSGLRMGNIKRVSTEGFLQRDSEELTPRSSLKRSSSASTTSSSATKRSKKRLASESSFDNVSNVKVIFTGLPEKALVKARKIVESLGGKVVERWEDCTHLVTDKVRRTVKFLCIVARGIPVVDIGWLEASKKSKSFIDSSMFILKDAEAEKKFNFSMERSLECARSRSTGLLADYKVHATPNVRPQPADMKEIIKSAKGQIVARMPASHDSDIIVLSCEEDKELCEKANVPIVYTAELLLTGILRQELDLDEHQLTFKTSPEVSSSSGKSKARRKR